MKITTEKSWIIDWMELDERNSRITQISDSRAITPPALLFSNTLAGSISTCR